MSSGFSFKSLKLYSLIIPKMHENIQLVKLRVASCWTEYQL